MLKRHKGIISKTAFTSVYAFVGTIASHAGEEVIHQGEKAVKQKLLEEKNTTKAIVMMLAGCRDEQTSADTNAFGSGSTGAMSYSFITALTQCPNHTWESLIRSMRDILHKGDKKFQQMPQLSMGKPIDPKSAVLF